MGCPDPVPQEQRLHQASPSVKWVCIQEGQKLYTRCANDALERGVAPHVIAQSHHTLEGIAAHHKGYGKLVPGLQAGEDAMS